MCFDCKALRLESQTFHKSDNNLCSLFYLVNADLHPQNNLHSLGRGHINKSLFPPFFFGQSPNDRLVDVDESLKPLVERVCGRERLSVLMLQLNQCPQDSRAPGDSRFPSYFPPATFSSVELQHYDSDCVLSAL